MPFPNISHCIVCEEVREEPRGLSTILGFYGIAPNVDILLHDFTKPLPRLTFFLLADRGQGRFMVSLQLKDEEGTVLKETPELELSMADPTRRNSWAFVWGSPLFPRPGQYGFVFKVSGQAYYEASFQVRQGESRDFVRIDDLT